MKKYYAWSYEHSGAFWKKGKAGYTHFEELAHKFTEEEILLMQIIDPYSGWGFVDFENFDSINLEEKNGWAVCVDDFEAIEKLKAFIPQWGELAKHEFSRLTHRERCMLYR